MTIDALTMMVVDVLGKYIIDGGAMLVREVGESAAQLASRLFTLVMERLKVDSADAEYAESFENKPHSDQAPTASAVAEMLNSDPEFAAQLSALMEEYKKSARESMITEIRSRTTVMQGGIAAGEGGVVVSGNVTGGIKINNSQRSDPPGGSDP